MTASPVSTVPPPATSLGSRPSGAKQLRPLVGKGVWGLGDQMLISGTNFVTMVFLARALGPAAFGAFVLTYTVLQFANSLQGALIIQPHSVLGATRQGREYVDYTASTCVAQLALAALAALLAFVAAVVAYAWGWSVAPLLLALAPTAVAWQLQEFVRRVLYTELRFGAAFANDVVSYGGQTVAIVALAWLGELTAPRGLYAIAVTSAMAAAVGVWQLRSSLFGRFHWQAIDDNWRYGRWLGGAEIGYWLSSQMYLYLSGMMLGPLAAGVMKAGYIIFGPARVLGFFLRTVLPTWFARTLAADGKLGLHAQIKMVYLASIPVLGAYCLLVALLADPLVRLLYGDKYAGHTTVVVLYAVFAFTAFMASIVSSALRAQRKTRYIFATQMAAMGTLPAGWLLIRQFGVEGAVAGMILTSLVLNVSYGWAYRRGLQQADPAAPTTVPTTAPQPGGAA